MINFSLQGYLAMPWTIVREEHSDDGEYLSLTVLELPGFVVAARTEDELESEFWPAFEAFLQSYIAAGERPPLPEVVRIQLTSLETQIAQLVAPELDLGVSGPIRPPVPAPILPQLMDMTSRLELGEPAYVN